MKVLRRSIGGVQKCRVQDNGYLDVLGTVLSLENRIDEAIDAHCTGLSYAPFYVPNYFGRGRRHNVKGEWKQGLADFILCTQLEPQNWTYWYYRATTENIQGMVEESIGDFKECLNITRPSLIYKSFDFPTAGFQLRDTYSVP